jgi:hypothetical protein
MLTLETWLEIAKALGQHGTAIPHAEFLLGMYTSGYNS